MINVNLADCVSCKVKSVKLDFALRDPTDTSADAAIFVCELSNCLMNLPIFVYVMMNGCDQLLNYVWNMGSSLTVQELKRKYHITPN